MVVFAAVREIRRRDHTLREHAGAEKYPKGIVVPGAIFMAVQLETTEINAAEGGGFDPGQYTQMSNRAAGHPKGVGVGPR